MEVNREGAAELCGRPWSAGSEFAEGGGLQCADDVRLPVDLGAEHAADDFEVRLCISPTAFGTPDQIVEPAIHPVLRADISARQL